MALVLGLTVWVVAAVEQASFVTADFPEPIPLQVSYLGSDLVVGEAIPETVEIVIRAPQAVISGLTASDFQANLDLEGRGEGTHRVVVRVDSRSRLVRVVEVTPGQLTVTIDQRAEKGMPVEVVVEWDEPPGFALGEAVVTPPQVVVSGPEAVVEVVAQVVVQLSLPGVRSTVEGSYLVVAVDNTGTPLPNLKIIPETVSVLVPIEPRLGFREMAVKPEIRGTVASGYWISNIQVSLPTVTIFGDPLIVERLAGFLETEPLDVQGATERLEIQVGLVLPSGVELLGAKMILVTIEVSPLLGGQTVQVTPLLEGLREGLEASFSPSTVEIILSGPIPDLQSLKADDIQVILDLSRLGPGTYRLTPRVEVPASLEVESVVPSQIEVVISQSG